MKHTSLHRSDRSFFAEARLCFNGGADNREVPRAPEAAPLPPSLVTALQDVRNQLVTAPAGPVTLNLQQLQKVMEALQKENNPALERITKAMRAIPGFPQDRIPDSFIVNGIFGRGADIVRNQLADAIAKFIAVPAPRSPDATAKETVDTKQKYEADRKVAILQTQLKALKLSVQQEMKKKDNASPEAVRKQLGVIQEGINAIPETDRKPMIAELARALGVPPEQAMKRMQEILNEPTMERFFKDLLALQNYVPGQNSPFIDLQSAEGTENLINRYVNHQNLEKGIWAPLRARFGNRAVEMIQSMLISSIQSFIAMKLATGFTRLEGTDAGAYVQMGRNVARDLHRRMALNSWRKGIASERRVDVNTLPPIENHQGLGISDGQMKQWNALYEMWGKRARDVRSRDSSANVGRPPNFGDTQNKESIDAYLTSINSTEDQQKGKKEGAAAELSPIVGTLNFGPTRRVEVGEGTAGSKRIEFTDGTPAVTFLKRGPQHFMEFTENGRTRSVELLSSSLGGSPTIFNKIELGRGTGGSDGVKVIFNGGTPDESITVGALMKSAIAAPLKPKAVFTSRTAVEFQS